MAPDARFLADRYELGERVGSGGMGDVFRGRDRLLDRPVAVKIPTNTITPASAERFRREARAAARLNHPNVVAVYDWGGEPTPFIVMEFVDGHSLRSDLSRRGRLPPREVAAIGAQIADALAHAHHQGIVHRDVKPSNVLVTSHGTVKVTDFGIAQSVAAEALTEPGVVLGTVGYLSPEQVAGLAADARSDVYSLGIVLVELLTGERPTGGEPEPDNELGRIIARAHADDPSVRYQEAADLRDDLRRVAQAMAASTADVPLTARIVTTATTTATATAGSGMVPPTQPTTGALPTAVLVAPAATVAAPGAPAKAAKPARPVKPLKPPKPRRRARVDGKTAVAAAAASPPPAARTWRLRHYLVLLAALVPLVAAGVVAYTRLADHAPLVAVPDVVDNDVFTAAAAMRHSGFKVETVVVDSPRPGGLVLAQQPTNGETLEQGSSVRLTLSRTDATVPDVVSLDEAEARSALARRGLINVTVTPDYRDDVDPGVVMGTTPAAFLKATKSEPVVLVVAADPHVTLQNVVGADQATATNQLHGQGLDVVVQTASSRSAAAGQVIKMSPSAGQVLVRGDTVTLVVSSGPKLVTVRSTVGEDRGNAISDLQDQGFAVVVNTAPSSGDQDGEVLAQSPPGGQLPEGSTVTITVGVRTRGK